MSKKKKDKLLLNLLESERHRHRVAMVTEEDTFNQHEPNSNMARMFVVMLLIHVVVIGGIIIYDFVNGEKAPETRLNHDYTEAAASGLPASMVDLDVMKGHSPDDFSTYEWKSGDSIRSVAAKLEVPEDLLIKLNKVDQGRQIKTNDVIIFPKRPVVKAQGVGVAGANGELPKPVDTNASIAAAEVPINLALPGEKGFTFAATIENELMAEPNVAPAPAVQDSPPPAVTKEASAMPVRVELPATKSEAPKIVEHPPEPVVTPAPKPVAKVEVEKPVPKAIPVPRPEPEAAPVLVKAPVKKLEQSPPPAKKETPKPASASSVHVVQSGETLYRIASMHKISVKALQDANKNVRPEAMKIGTKLVIPRK
ncbi:LysM domain-containing protein [Prosthecobacter debontii]|uniref:LysM domain-containing protein n=1 Tax=Prosthecobacter debontii TaxID=48467 RepID=A0A1T4XS93_9BACT|nr:LysM peptidoglycan-binding domain-containing protein [Prosthecobacter debontii]SKA92417.1 LysM domain-containing protein [Prosthecobacter debontii]